MTKSIEQSIKEKIRQIAAAESRQFNEVWLAVIMERWLARLWHSKHREHFIFKGGMCLGRYISIGRETRDLDFLLKGLKANQNAVAAAFQEISAADLNDGFHFDFASIDNLAHAHKQYPGYRITLKALLGGTKTNMRIDLGVGDRVAPENITIHLAANKGVPLFEKDIELWAYPPEAIFSEKYETAIRRDALNSRMKDYHDLVLMIHFGILDEQKIKDALDRTFRDRKTEFGPLPAFTSADLDRMEKSWTAHLRTLRAGKAANDLPRTFAEVQGIINAWIARIPR